MIICIFNNIIITDHDEAQLQSMMRPNRDTIEGYFLAGKHMFWLPVRIRIRMIQMIRRMVIQTK